MFSRFAGASLSHSSPKPLLRARYDSAVDLGVLGPDSAQEEAVGILQKLATHLEAYHPATQGLFGSLLSRKSPSPRGLYLYGDVGRGKSMLMDLFFDSVKAGRKRRVHFHQFMLEAHARLHKLQSGPFDVDGILPQLARDLAREAWLLCFDEFHVSNIADAMILGRLFTALFEEGTVIVATSNWPPDELYKNGLQRDRFVPFIGVLKQHMDVHRLAGTTDHRYARMHGTPSYFYPLGAETTERLAGIFAQLTDQAAPEPLALPVQGRSLAVPRAAKGVAFFTFGELCSQPLGAADFLALAECFHTVLLNGVPRLKAEQRNETLRFMTLIDALYEAKVKLFMAADAPPAELYKEGEHAFAFKRTASRLVEMQSEDYRRLAHLG